MTRPDVVTSSWTSAGWVNTATPYSQVLAASRETIARLAHRVDPDHPRFDIEEMHLRQDEATVITVGRVDTYGRPNTRGGYLRTVHCTPRGWLLSSGSNVFGRELCGYCVRPGHPGPWPQFRVEDRARRGGGKSWVTCRAHLPEDARAAVASWASEHPAPSS